MQHEVAFYGAMLSTTTIQDLMKSGKPILSRYAAELLEKLFISLRQALSECRTNLDAIVYGIQCLVAVHVSIILLSSVGRLGNQSRRF